MQGAMQVLGFFMHVGPSQMPGTGSTWQLIDSFKSINVPSFLRNILHKRVTVSQANNQYLSAMVDPTVAEQIYTMPELCHR